MADSSNSNQHIEDVLSSIRRLVGDEAAGKTAAHADSGDRLVLTPQLRVTEPEDPYQPIETLQSEAVEDPDGLGVFRSGASLSLESDQADEPSDDDEALLDIHQAEEDAEEAVILGRINGEVPEDAPIWPDADVKFARTLAALFESARGPADAGSDDDDDDDLAYAQPPEAAPVEAPHTPEAAPQEPQEPQEPLSLAGAIPFPQVQKQERSLSEPLTENLGLPDDMVVDEEALRDLIAEVVREELAGHLGERITRNVRKLVRREIRRLMASEEFE